MGNHFLNSLKSSNHCEAIGFSLEKAKPSRFYDLDVTNLSFDKNSAAIALQWKEFLSVLLCFASNVLQTTSNLQTETAEQVAPP